MYHVINQKTGYVSKYSYSTEHYARDAIAAKKHKEYDQYVVAVMVDGAWNIIDL
jgi:hypothetical protein